MASGIARRRSKKSEIDKLLGDEGALVMLYEADRDLNNEKLVPEKYIGTALTYLKKRGQKDVVKPGSRSESVSTASLPIANVAASPKVSPRKRSTSMPKIAEIAKAKQPAKSPIKANSLAGIKSPVKSPIKQTIVKSTKQETKATPRKGTSPAKTGTPARGKMSVKTPLKKVQGTPGRIAKKGKEKPKIAKILKALKPKNKGEVKKKLVVKKPAVKLTRKSTEKAQSSKVPSNKLGASKNVFKPAQAVKKAVKILPRSKTVVKSKVITKKPRGPKKQPKKDKSETNENTLGAPKNEPFDPDAAFAFVFEPRPPKNPAEMSRIVRRRSWSSDSSMSDLESEEQTQADIQSAMANGSVHEDVPDITSSMSVDEPPFPVIRKSSKKKGNASIDSEAGSETASLRSDSSVSSYQACNNLSSFQSPRKKGPSILAPISVDGPPECSPPLSSMSTASDVNNQSGAADGGISTDVVSSLPPTVQNSSRSEGQRSSLRQAEAHYHYKELTLRKLGHVTQIIFNPVSTKLKNAFSVPVLKEFRGALLSLRKDKHCKVVLMTSVNRIFCQGVDLPSLVHSTPERCKKAAVEMADAIKYFIWTLAHFPKPIVAGVEGKCIGLGAAMLPLFDLVYASDTATFCMPYGKLGQVPEGAVSLSFPVVFGNSLTCSLLYGSRKLTATEAQNCGLITGVLWPDRFLEELIPMVQALAGHASQGMESTKALLRQQVRSKLAVTLENESTLLVHHWSSQEGQRLIKQYLTSDDVISQ